MAWKKVAGPFVCPFCSMIACSPLFKRGLGLQIAAVDELETEPALDAKVAVRDLDIEG